MDGNGRPLSKHFDWKIRKEKCFNFAVTGDIEKNVKARERKNIQKYEERRPIRCNN